MRNQVSKGLRNSPPLQSLEVVEERQALKPRLPDCGTSVHWTANVSSLGMHIGGAGALGPPPLTPVPAAPPPKSASSLRLPLGRPVPLQLGGPWAQLLALSAPPPRS